MKFFVAPALERVEVVDVCRVVIVIFMSPLVTTLFTGGPVELWL
jgi:hypothetical protein